MLQAAIDFITYDPADPMVFTVRGFWIFFLLLLIGYQFVYKRSQARMLYLLAFSLFFYYKSGGYFFFLLLFSTIFDYVVGNKVYHASTRRRSLAWLSFSVLMNLGILGFFKYAGFLVDTWNSAFHTNYVPWNFLSAAANQISAALRIPLDEPFSVSSIILPVGISFYTFQTISYSVDLYRRKITPARNVLDFGFFVTYFPQLVAGPIVRANEFLPQMYEPYRLSEAEYRRAIVLILMGMVKKVLVSDYISLNFVDRIFEAPGKYTGFENLMAVYGYTIQIYCDFSGYTDIAIGVSLLLGFHLPLNFNSPYKSADITDFWRRWHISLSTWLKDYVYIPLGGNRKGKFRQYLNLFLTMFVGGLWHGAHAKFIVWGCLHGLALALHKLWMGITGQKSESIGKFPARASARLYYILMGVVTFHFVAYCWIYFRAVSFAQVHEITGRIFNAMHPELIAEQIVAYWKIFAVIAAGYAFHFLPRGWKVSLGSVFARQHWSLQAVGVSILVVLLYQVTSSESQPFIYFQF